MTTSFTRTREQLAAMVLAKLKRQGGSSNNTNAELSDVYEAIDLRLKEMHRLGIFWRKVTSVPVTFSLSAGVATCSAGAGDLLFPIKVTFRNNAVDDPVEIIGRTQYAVIEDKTYSGNPTKIMWKGGSEFVTWPVPLYNGTCDLLYEKIADDTAASTAPDIDVSMLRWLKDVIAFDLADTFGVPEARYLRMAKESEIAERRIRALAVEHTDIAIVQVEPQRRHEATGVRRDWRTG